MADIVKMSLEAVRVNAGLTQKEAAEKLGISNKTLGSWENYVTSPPVSMIEKICDLYGVTYDHINFLPNRSL
jgi:transcriptional regulator with XRE-family HTH domain